MKKQYTVYVISCTKKGVRFYLDNVFNKTNNFLDAHLFKAKNNAIARVKKEENEDEKYVTFRENLCNDKDARKNMAKYEVLEVEMKIKK